MLAAHGFNSDVQLPYRLPITAHTYSCDGACLTDTNNDDMVMAAQFAQDAQAGYACDYSNKRQPMAFSEVKECIKGIRALGGQLRGDSIGYQGKRYALRLCSDWYGRGIVRGQAEIPTSEPTLNQTTLQVLKHSAPVKQYLSSVASI